MSWLLWTVLQWTLECMYLFELDFSLDRYPGVGLLDHMEALLSVFKETSVLFYESVLNVKGNDLLVHIPTLLQPSHTTSLPGMGTKSFSSEWFCLWSQMAKVQVRGGQAGAESQILSFPSPSSLREPLRQWFPGVSLQEKWAEVRAL